VVYVGIWDGVCEPKPTLVIRGFEAGVTPATSSLYLRAALGSAWEVYGPDKLEQRLDIVFDLDLGQNVGNREFSVWLNTSVMPVFIVMPDCWR
jgi:hypothetical protein